MRRIIYSALLLVAITMPGLAQEKGVEAGGAPKETKAEAKVFSFEGGNLRDFLFAVKQQLGFDLERAASIDRSAYNLRIPKMKIPAHEGWEGVLSRYNNLSFRTEIYTRLGRWIISPEPHKRDIEGQPEAIMFVPPNNLGNAPTVKVRAFSLDKLKKEDLSALKEAIEVEAHSLAATGASWAFEGRIRYHERTGLLVASGSADYVELAATIIEAFKETLDRRGPSQR